MIGSRIRSRRSGAILAATLIISAALPGLVTAADTRVLWIGAPSLAVDANGDNIPDNSGKLFVTQSSGQLPTRVSVPATVTPNATMFQVEILNSGGQNLAHTILKINADVQGATGLSLNPTYYDPDGETDASSDFCSTSGDVITCDYGSLSAGSSRTVAVVVDVSDAYVAATQLTPLFSATVTTNNENGSNTQTFTATSGPQVDSGGIPIPGSPAFKVDALAANSVYTFALDGVSEELSTSGVGSTGGPLSTKVNFNTANKELITINEGTSTTLYPCPNGRSCEDFYSEVTTSSGSFADPFITWKLTAIVPKTYSLAQGFVAHYPTGAQVYNETLSDQYWTLLFKNKSALCGTDIPAKIASAKHCIYSLSLTKYDRTSNLLVVEVVMDHQGGMKY